MPIESRNHDQMGNEPKTAEPTGGSTRSQSFQTLPDAPVNQFHHSKFRPVHERLLGNQLQGTHLCHKCSIPLLRTFRAGIAADLEQTHEGFPQNGASGINFPRPELN